MNDDQEVIVNSLLAEDVDVATSYVASIPNPAPRPSCSRAYQVGLLIPKLMQDRQVERGEPPSQLSIFSMLVAERDTLV